MTGRECNETLHLAPKSPVKVHVKLLLNRIIGPSISLEFAPRNVRLNSDLGTKEGSAQHCVTMICLAVSTDAPNQVLLEVNSYDLLSKARSRSLSRPRSRKHAARIMVSNEKRKKEMTGN